MIDTTTEDLITLTQAAREQPSRTGKRGINVSTIWRWAKGGLQGIQLETICIGGIRYTSREALRRFFADSTAARDGTTPQPRTPRQRDRAIAVADSVLSEAGL